MLWKTPVPVPLVVLPSANVGAAVVAQQTPLAVTELPPSSVISPPETADVCATEEAIAVVSVANVIAVVSKDNSFP